MNSSANHNSLNKNPILSRHSLENSITVSLTKKMSASTLKNYVDIDRLIDNIKLTPQKTNAQQHLSDINTSLASLKEIPIIFDEVRTIELLLESISKKLNAEELANTRLKHTQSLQRDSSIRRSNVSPVRQFDAGSRIVYANYSIKDMVGGQMETPIKRYNDSEREESEMDKLNSEIMALEQLLKAKTMASEAKPLQTPPQPHTNPKHNKLINKENTPAPKKYSLLEKTQEISLVRPRATPHERSRPRGEHNYR